MILHHRFDNCDVHKVVIDDKSLSIHTNIFIFAACIAAKVRELLLPGYLSVHGIRTATFTACLRLHPLDGTVHCAEAR